MTLEEREKLDNKYESLSCLLLYFLEDTYLPEDEWDDENTIKRYVNTFDKARLEKVIIQGKQILSLQEFPADWVGDLSNRFPFKMSNEATPQDYYDWVKWMIDTLEVEAKKIGRL